MRARRGGELGIGRTRTFATGLATTLLALGTVAGAVLVSPPVTTPAGAAAPPATTCVGATLQSNNLENPRPQAVLAVGQALCSGQYQLVMQGDGNLVLYDGTQGRPTWASGTVGSTGSVATFTGYTLCVAGWCTPNGSQNSGGTWVLQLSSDGNLGIHAYGGTNLTWQTGTGGADYSQLLEAGQSLASPDGQYQLDMQSDGNLVLYYVPQSLELWQTDTAGHTGAVAVMQDDGNLVVYGQGNGTSSVLYATGSSATNPTLVVQDDGNLVVYGMSSSGPYAAWAADTVGSRGTTLLAGQTLQPGQFLQSANHQYTLQMSTGGVLALYSTQPYACALWTAPTIASGSGYSATPQAGSYLVVDDGGGLDLDSPGTTDVWWTASQTDGWKGGGGGSDHLVLDTDGNLVLSTASGGVGWTSNTEKLRGSILCTGTDLTQTQFLVAWTAGTSSSPAAPRYTSVMMMQADCNLVLYNNHTAVWSSGTSTDTAGEKGSPLPDPGGHGYYNNCFAAMQTDGNLVVYAPTYPGGQIALWASGTNQSKAPPFNLGAIGPYLTIPIVGGTTQAPFVTTSHGKTLGDPDAPKSSNALKVLGDVFDALGLVFTFVGGPLGAVFAGVPQLGNILGAASIASDLGGTAVSAAGTQSNALGLGPVPAGTPDDLGSNLTSTDCANAGGWGGCLLQAGQFLVSPNQQYELLMQADGNLVLYERSQGTPIWTANTAGNPGAFLRVQANGYVAVLDSTNSVQLFYATGSVGTPDPDLALQDDGNLVLYGKHPGGAPFATWSTGTVPASGSLSTCGSLSVSQTAIGLGSGGCLVSPNRQYELRMQTDGNLVLYFKARTDPLWAAFPNGPPAGVTDDTLVLYADGDLCVKGWCNNVTAANATLVLQNSGNLAELGNNSTFGAPVLPYVAWQTATSNLRGNLLPPGADLGRGQYLESANRAYKLSMGTTGLLELSYLTRPAATPGSYFCPMWSRPYQEADLADFQQGDGARYSQAPVGGSSLAMQGDGNLVVGGSSGSSPIDISGTQGQPGAYVELGTDGNLVVYAAAGNVLWQSGTNEDRGSTLCTNAVLYPGQYLTELGTPETLTTNILMMTGTCQLAYYGEGEVNGVRDGVGVTPFWKTTTTFHTAGCDAVMQGDGNLVIYAPNHSGAVWASTTVQSPLPPNLVENLGPFSLVNPGDTSNNTGAGAEIVSDSGTILWEDPPVHGAFAAADGEAAVSGVQSLVAILVFLLPLLL